jgi:hypothetical protein
MEAKVSLRDKSRPKALCTDNRFARQNAAVWSGRTETQNLTEKSRSGPRVVEMRVCECVWAKQKQNKNPHCAPLSLVSTFNLSLTLTLSLSLSLSLSLPEVDRQIDRDRG